MAPHIRFCGVVAVNTDTLDTAFDGRLPENVNRICIKRWTIIRQMALFSELGKSRQLVFGASNAMSTSWNWIHTPKISCRIHPFFHAQSMAHLSNDLRITFQDRSYGTPAINVCRGRFRTLRKSHDSLTRAQIENKAPVALRSAQGGIGGQFHIIDPRRELRSRSPIPQIMWLTVCCKIGWRRYSAPVYCLLRQISFLPQGKLDRVWGFQATIRGDVSLPKLSLSK